MNETIQTVVTPYWADILNILLGIIGDLAWLLIAFLAVQLRKVVPTWLALYIDDKRQRDLHKAVMTAVKAIIQDGRNPLDYLGEIRDWVRSFGAPNAAEHFGLGIPSAKANDALNRIAHSKIQELAEAGKAAVEVAVDKAETVVADTAKVVAEPLAQAKSQVEDAMKKVEDAANKIL